jgi:ATP-dependent Clp protease adaptor protein ClpS
MTTIPDAHLLLKQDADTEEPHLYAVILLNDDYTTMEFVVRILVTVFGQTLEKAEELMLRVHRLGKAVCGRYTYDIAVSKIECVRSLSRQEQYPLRCDLERE